MAEMWFQSEKGIRQHYREARETEKRLHNERISALGEQEDAFIEAFRSTQNKG